MDAQKSDRYQKAYIKGDKNVHRLHTHADDFCDKNFTGLLVWVFQLKGSFDAIDFYRLNRNVKKNIIKRLI